MKPLNAPVLGTQAGCVELVPYDPRWPDLFCQERERLYAALGAVVIAIEHVGSTAVGLASKPTLDILAALSELKGSAHYLPCLAPLGYRFRPDHPVPGRLHFARIDAGLRTHNLSLAVFGSPFWEEHLQFRDILRSDARMASDYTGLKRRLAKEHPQDPIAYTAGKDAFIAWVLERAGE